jgi:hypothetical protein
MMFFSSVRTSVQVLSRIQSPADVSKRPSLCPQRRLVSSADDPNINALILTGHTIPSPLTHYAGL